MLFPSHSSTLPPLSTTIHPMVALSLARSHCQIHPRSALVTAVEEGDRGVLRTHFRRTMRGNRAMMQRFLPSFLTSKRHHCKFLIFMMPSVVALNVSLLCLVFLPGGRWTAARSPPPPASSSWGSLPAMAKATLTTKSVLFRAFHGASRRAFTL